jgi:Spy/CpxP family protein refolding chaperone
MSDLFNDPVELPPAPKMNKGKKIFISSIIVVVILVAVVAVGYAKMMGSNHGGPLGMMLDKMTKDLNLTTDQKTQVDQLKAEIKAKMDAKKDANKDARKQSAEDFANLFKQNTLDKQAVQDLAAKREKDREDMKSFMMDELVKFHDILTPDQRTKVADKIVDFASHKHEKDGKKKPENN